MDELTRLLAIDTAGMTVDELAAHRVALQQAMVDAAAEGNLDDAALEQLAAASTAVQTVQASIDAAEQDAAERAERARVLLEEAGIAAPAEGDEGEPAEVDGEAEVVADGDAAPAEVIVEEDAPAVIDEQVEEPVAVAASGVPAVRPVPRVSRVASRAPVVVPPPARERRAGHVREWGAKALTASGAHGAPITDARQLGDLFFSAYESAGRFSQGQGSAREDVPIIALGSLNLESLYPAERILSRDAKVSLQRVMEAQDHRNFVKPAGGDGSLVAAAGGICAPQQVSYDIPVIGSTARPVRNTAVTTFGADRGGVRMFPYGLMDEVDDLELLDLDAGGDGTENVPWSIWSNTKDITPGSDIKPCFEIDCPDDEEALVEAIIKCLVINNFRQRFFPELVAAYVEKLAIRFARVMERRLLAKIAAASTSVTTTEQLGTTRDVLAYLDLAIDGMRNRHRLEQLFPLRFVAPRWLLGNMRTDLVRAMPTGSLQENLAVADATIAAFITSRNVNITWAMDGEAGQDFGAQGDGAQEPYPTTAITYLYPEGSHLFLDGGSENFGVTRDSVLIRQNKFMMFEENWEGHFFHGPESQRITMNICPNGRTSGTADIDPCEAS